MKNKQDNIAEYILWIWQLEDYLRAFPNVATDRENPSHDIRFLTELSEILHREGVTENGHVQLAQNAIEEMEEQHQKKMKEKNTYNKTKNNKKTKKNK